MQVVVVRGVMQAIIMGSISRYRHIPFNGTENKKLRLLLFFVALTGGLRIFFIFTSFSRLPLGDSTSILFSSPIIGINQNNEIFYYYSITFFYYSNGHIDVPAQRTLWNFQSCSIIWSSYRSHSNIKTSSNIWKT